MRRVVRRIRGVTLLALCVGVFAGFAGRLYPFGDSLSVLPMPLRLACAIALAFQMARPSRKCVAAAAFLALITTVPLLATAQGGGTLLLYSKNLLYHNTDRAALADDIGASNADVVTLQEVGRRNDVFLTRMAEDYPFQHLCRFPGGSGMAALSKTPFVAESGCSGHRGIAVAQIAKDGQSVWVGPVHLPWPYPFDHEVWNFAHY